MNILRPLNKVIREVLCPALAVWLVTLPAQAGPTNSVNAANENVIHTLNKLVDDLLDKTTENTRYGIKRQDADRAAHTMSTAADSKQLLAILNQMDGYGESYEAKLYWKRQILFRALLACSSTSDIPDLLNSPAPEALAIIAAHITWQDNQEVSRFLASQLPSLLSNSDDANQPEWISESYIYGFLNDGSISVWEYSTAETREWIILYLACCS